MRSDRFAKWSFVGVVALLLVVILPGVASAQDAPALPVSYQLNGFTHIPQHWNNCGPATLTMGLTFYGVTADQDPAANWLKPTPEDGNVSPWQMIGYVNTQFRGRRRRCCVWVGMSPCSKRCSRTIIR